LEKRDERVFSGVDAQCKAIAGRLSGTLGIAVKTLESGDSFYLNEDETFPSASTIKIHILLELFNQVRSGQRSLAEMIDVPTSGRVGALWDQTSSGILKDLESVGRISLKDAATLMMIVSDNVATNLIVDLFGIEGIQGMIQSLGLSKTKFQRKMMDFESAAKGLHNITTPHDLMRTMEQIATAQVLDSSSCSAILGIMSRAQDVLGLRRLIPPTIRVEHKTGELDDVCNDVGIVRLPNEPFVIAVMTKSVNVVEGWDAVAEVGKLFHDTLLANRT
jgi:beta-lactamase class A